MSTKETDIPTESTAATAPASKVEHFTPAERAARGKAARAEVPRRVHGEWEPPPHRPDPVDLLEEQAETRVPELVPIRYGRMLVSPFTFYRGAAALMAADLAGTPRTGLHAQLCGDAHLSNFGVFAAPDRRLVFGVNDFDETLPGPFEWDVKRLVASFAVAGRDRGFDAEACGPTINVAVGRSYREAMREFAAMRNLDVWYARIDVEDVFARLRGRRRAPKQRKRVERNLAKARTKDSLQAFDKLTADRRRRAADRQRPAADRPDRRARRAEPGDGARAKRSRRDPRLPAHARRRPPPAARALPLRRRGAQGRRRRQRRHAGLDRADARPRRRRPAVPAGQGGAGVGARAVPRQERVTPTTASASSRASG